MTGVIALMVGTGSAASGTVFTATSNGTTFSGSIAGAGTATAGPCTITVSGGIAPYSYTWSRTSGDTGTTISSASAASVTWTRSYGPIPRSDSSTWKCSISDAASHSATISGITVNMENSADGGGGL